MGARSMALVGLTGPSLDSDGVLLMSGGDRDLAQALADQRVRCVLTADRIILSTPGPADGASIPVAAGARAAAVLDARGRATAEEASVASLTSLGAVVDIRLGNAERAGVHWALPLLARAGGEAWERIGSVSSAPGWTMDDVAGTFLPPVHQGPAPHRRGSSFGL